MDNLYSSYEDCLSVWLLNVYRDLHKNRTFGSLKLLLKLRNIKFLKQFSHVILNSRGDLDDPLVEFLLYLVSLVSPQCPDVGTSNWSSADSPTSDSLPRSPPIRAAPPSDGKEHTGTPEDKENATLKTATGPGSPSHFNSERRRAKGIGPGLKMGSSSIDSVADSVMVNTTPRTRNEAAANRGTGSTNRSPSILPSIFTSGGFRPGLSFREVTRRLTTWNLKGGVYTPGVRGFSRTGSASSDSGLIPGHVVFINMFLSALVPTLLYTYLRRVKENRNKHLAIIHDYHKFSTVSGATASNRRRDKRVFRSFRTNAQRLLLKVTSFKGLLGLIGLDNLSKELGVYESLFSHFSKPGSAGSMEPLDNTSGLQLLLYKLSLLNLSYHDHNYTEVPKNIYNIYNKLDDSVIKTQLESSLIYCYRLRINDLNLKLNVNKLFKNLIKFSKYPEGKFKRYYNPLVIASTSNLTHGSTSAGHNGVLRDKAIGNRGDANGSFAHGHSSWREFSDAGMLRVIMNDLVFFGNNLLYLNRVLSTSPISATCGSGANRAEGEGAAAFSNESYLDDSDRYMYYAYRILCLVKGADGGHNRAGKAAKFRPTLLRGLRINNMEYVYNAFLHLVRYVFQLKSTSRDVATRNTSHWFGATDTCKSDTANGNATSGGATSGTEDNNKPSLSNKYSIFDCRGRGKRVFVSDDLCLLVLKINFDFYRLVFTNLSALKEVQGAILASGQSKAVSEQDCCNVTHYSSQDLTDRVNAFVENDEDLARRYLYSAHTHSNVVSTFREVKRRISYEMYPVSYWLACSHLKLLESRLDSQCQSKPP
ncbi:conserved hypothetical protein [Theileria orientalis strain Shintoku]|uniref:Uncharacterized protein n=1 Tax=Theileria orientalis strain Shintoku TaxID=869250 RepID=J4CDP1_THEOR|nr:conserved hypothetical protein [Theileria orientalis strain Shintoku]BAM41482.1 conserved hypothetical protein [Theileria orientalis strain Shintoku]|eukprot:XP_009691783.1 conserved hypothetical protein [Theileria orientalis strain Shintoku]